MWSVTLNGHTIGGTSGWLLLSDIELWGGWEVRSMTIDNPAGDGLLSTGRDRIGERTLMFSTRYTAATQAEIQTALDALLNAWAPGDVSVLTVDTPAGERSMFGKAAKTVVDHSALPSAVRVALSYQLLDPLGYSPEVLGLASMGTVSGGQTYPHGYPHRYGTVVSGLSPWTNVGSVSSDRWGIIALAGRGGMTDPRFACGDGQVAFSGLSVPEGSVLWVDGHARSARVTTSLELSDAGRDVVALVDRRFGDAWFSVPPGPQVLRWSGSGESVALVSLRSAWRV